MQDSLPEIAAIIPSSAAARAGLMVGDLICEINGVLPRDVIEWHHLVENDHIEIVARRGNADLEIAIDRQPNEPFGAEVSSAVFDRVQTCDNHCEFCFIYQLPQGMRKSLYLKDDDYRLSFLYGNFTTLTRFTEADFERVVSQRLSPLYVSIHATEPHCRAEMLRNPRGGMSLRWLQELGRANIAVRGQIVLCPGVNDAEVFERTMLDLLDQFSFLESVAVVPLGLSKHNTESRMRVQTPAEARAMVLTVTRWQHTFREHLGRRFVYLADEFYLLAGEPIPEDDAYGSFDMVEDGIGIARRFLNTFHAGESELNHTPTQGFFASVSARELAHDSNPTAYVSNPASETSLRRVAIATEATIRPLTDFSRLVLLTGTCAAPVLQSVVSTFGDDRISVAALPNTFFGGNTSVAGLLTGTEVIEFLNTTPDDHTTLYVLPDVCLNQKRFLDGVIVDEVARVRPLRVLNSDGASLRRFLERFKSQR